MRIFGVAKIWNSEKSVSRNPDSPARMTRLGMFSGRQERKGKNEILAPPNIQN